MSIKHPKVTVLLLLVQLAHSKHCSMYKHVYFGNFCPMKCDGVDRMFPFAKQDISEWCSRYEPKNN